MIAQSRTCWAVLWRSENKLDGRREWLLNGADCLPYLFRTREEARDFIRERCDDIRKRPDLRKEPHGWKRPIPVRVTIRVDLGQDLR